MFYRNSNMYKSKMEFKEYVPVSFDKGLDIENKSNDFGTCKEIYNFDYNDGCLKDSFGIETLRCIESLALMGEHTYSNCRFSDEESICRCFFKQVLVGDEELWSIMLMYDFDGDFNFYVINKPNKGVINVPSMKMTNCASVKFFSTFINGQETFVFYDYYYGKVYVWVPRENSVATVSQFYPLIEDMCFCGNRTFFISRSPESTTVMYSEEFNGFNFTISNKEIGCVKLKDELGRCRRIINFNDEIFVFRDRGINKIYQSRNKINFDSEKVYLSDSLIYEDTVCVCGDKILFLTTDGLYEFNGNSVNKLDFKWPKLFNYKKQFFSKSTYFNGVYYLACEIDYNDNKKILGENYQGKYVHTVIKYDVNTKEAVVCRGLSVVDFIPIIDKQNNQMGVLYIDSNKKNQIGMLNETGVVKNDTLLKKWTSKQYDFGNKNKYKFIKDMQFTTYSDITLNLYIDDKIKSIEVKGNSTMQTVKINQKAKLFGYGFETLSGNNYITNPKFSVGML